jgi:predicted nucleic acid-binding protein
MHAPQLVLFELIETLRHAERDSFLSREEAAEALAEALALEIHYWPVQGVVDRVWELRHNVTIYDASYVALAELLDAPLLTIDERLTRAPGPRCEFLVP